MPPAGAVPLVDAAERRVGGDASLVPCQAEQGLCLSPSGKVLEALYGSEVPCLSFVGGDGSLFADDGVGSPASASASASASCGDGDD